MIKIFFKKDGEILLTQSCQDLTSSGSILWIDLLDPSGDEKRAVEAFIGTEIQSRAQAEEIESSSHYSESEQAIFCNTNFLSPSDDEMSMDPVSFILSKGVLVTLRDIPLRSFDLLQRKMQARPGLFSDCFAVFIAIVDKRVDLDADLVELISQDTTQFSKRINQKEDINEEFLLDINQLQENAMLVRENVVDKQRIISNVSKSDLCPEAYDHKFAIILQDTASLINHINFTFERLEYLQDTVVGIINLDQNRIMKTFTFISLLLMPTTLVASFYGMNVSLPFSDRWWAWVAIIGVMALIIVVLLFIFRHKKMLK